MKRLRVIYILMPIVVIICTLLMEGLQNEGYSMVLSPYVAYIERFVVVLVSLASMVSAFTLLKSKPIVLMLALNVAALMVICDYYMNIGNEGSDNLVWLLSMISLVYIIKYKSIVSSSYTKDDADEVSESC
ncbi:MAG: hypothetical protein K2J00_04705 [Bacteroidaceae bacterium]|nr:hypothetical protein [Bacteroidaceae bacterium]